MVAIPLSNVVRTDARLLPEDVAGLVYEISQRLNEARLAGARASAPAFGDVGVTSTGEVAVRASGSKTSTDTMTGLASFMDELLRHAERPPASLRLLAVRARGAQGLPPLLTPGELAEAIEQRFDVTTRHESFRALAMRGARGGPTTVRPEASQPDTSDATFFGPPAERSDAAGPGPGTDVASSRPSPRATPPAPAPVTEARRAAPLQARTASAHAHEPKVEALSPAGPRVLFDPVGDATIDTLESPASLRVRPGPSRDPLHETTARPRRIVRAIFVLAVAVGCFMLGFLSAQEVGVISADPFGWGTASAGGAASATRSASWLDGAPAAAARQTPVSANRAESAASPTAEIAGSNKSTATTLEPRPIQTPSIAGPVFSPSFGEGGSTLLFHAGREPQSRLVEGQIGPEGSLQEVRVISSGGGRHYHPRLSPDGRFVAFDSDRDGERGVYVANRDGSGVRRVSGDGHAAVPSWSPDMAWLTFVKSEPERPDVWNLWMRNLASGELRRLTGHGVGQTWGASWFADSRRVCYSHEDRLIVRDVITGRGKAYMSPRPGQLVRTPAVSPDGTRVVFQLHRDGIWLLELEDGSMRRIIADPSAEEFSWDPTGRRMAYHSRRDGEWRVWIMGPPPHAG